jgi:hypothetical protein
MDNELQCYLEGKFLSLEGRVTLVEREVHQLAKNQLTGEQATTIFRTTSLRTNTITRVAVALIAALGVGTTSVQNVLATHDAASLELRCQKGTSDALTEYDKRREVRDVEIARKAIQLRDTEIDRIIGKGNQ